MSSDENIESPGKNWRATFIAWPRYQKRVVLITIDALVLLAAVWVPLCLRYGTFFMPTSTEQLLLLLAGPVITLAMLWRIGLYRLVTRFIGFRGMIQIILSILFSMLLWAVAVFMFGQLGVPRSTILVYGGLAALGICLIRYGIGLLLNTIGIRVPHWSPREQTKKPVVIYGAGAMGVALLKAVRQARDRSVVAFVDPSPDIWRQYVNGIKVYPPSKIERLIEREDLQEILVALPGTQTRERRKLLHDLEHLPVEVKVLPAYEDLASGRISVNKLRPVQVEDLLGRDLVHPDPELLGRSLTNKAIMITGAGGSIGSELVRQIIRQEPRIVILYELSELALYEIEAEIRTAADMLPPSAKKPVVKGILGSVLDREQVSQAIVGHGVQTIFHAAAYKHVPIVEENPVTGLTNNVFGTLVVSECAREHGVERFVLISTDKAVRPTNIMGASKRLAELILQAAAAESSETIFTMVRFGNVLNSSGSVVPRFRSQIEAGGPITVTHPDITRYFMSIPEAAELVIQAGAMARGGEVFVLHMGEPVKIDSLARLMIRLSGLEVCDETNPSGDIEIAYTGLRPGEKLYEELLISENTSPTEHPRIFKCEEPFLSKDALLAELEALQAAMDTRDAREICTLLARTVEGFKPAENTQAASTLENQNIWPPTSTTLH